MAAMLAPTNTRAEGVEDVRVVNRPKVTVTNFPEVFRPPTPSQLVDLTNPLFSDRNARGLDLQIDANGVGSAFQIPTGSDGGIRIVRRP